MREQILAILQEINPDIDYEKEKQLIDGACLDSFSVIRLVTELMEAFDIELDADDLEPEKLNSLDNICALVKEKQEA